MHIYTSLEQLPKTKMALIIGTFDGVHRGHQALLKKLKSYGVPTGVLTFSTHPLQTLRPPAPVPITSLPVKLQLLEKCGIDCAIVLPFPEIMNIPYDQFLNLLPISHLLLGEGDAFGKNREGTRANIEAWGGKHHVHIEYMKKLDNISSSRIREAIKSGNFQLAETLLGHTNYEKNNVN